MSSPQSSGSTPARYNRLLHGYAVFMTFWAFLVVFIGATVKSHEAGLSIPEGFILHWIPDWWNLPNLKWEFLHRLLVGIFCVGLLGFVTLVLTYDNRRFVRWIVALLIVAVAIQAVLGKETVDQFAHWWTSIPHAALGQADFALLASLTTMLSKSWMDGPPGQPQTVSPPLHKLARALVIAVFIQLLLGGAIRHDDHGKAIQTGREWVYYTHVAAHVIGALFVTYYMARVLFRIFSQHRIPQFMRFAHALMMLLTLQLILGTLAAVLKLVYSQDFPDLPPGWYADMPPPLRAWIATAHVAIGALIFAISGVLWARSYRFVDATEKIGTPSDAASGTLESNVNAAGATA